METKRGRGAACLISPPAKQMKSAIGLGARAGFRQVWVMGCRSATVAAMHPHPSAADSQGTDSQRLTIHQFLQTDQSAGSPQMACRQV